MYKVIEQILKIGPAAVLGLVLGIATAEWVNAGDPVEQLSASGYKLIVFLVTLVTVALWHGLAPIVKARRTAPDPAAPDEADPPSSPSGD
ncbi:MAG: hypothetical protein CML68_13875 [Rhodobacteraceae bacterium]|nr:hypothetical protein [Paracoccaceae bacterium]